MQALNGERQAVENEAAKLRVELGDREARLVAAESDIATRVKSLVDQQAESRRNMEVPSCVACARSSRRAFRSPTSSFHVL